MLAPAYIDPIYHFEFFFLCFLFFYPPLSNGCRCTQPVPKSKSCSFIVVPYLYSLGRTVISDVDDVVQVVAHGNEQVEEQLAAAGLHLSLHGAATLKRLAAADDQSKVVSTEATVRIRRVGISVLGRPQDGADVDAGMQPLLAQSQTLQLLEAVPIGGTVDDCVTQDLGPHAGEIDGGIGARAVVRGWWWLLRSPHAVLELPGVTVPVVNQAWIVVSLVEILEHCRKDLGLLVGKGDSLVHGIRRVLATSRLEKGRLAEDILVCRKKTSLAANGKGDNRRGRDIDGLSWCRFVLYDRALQLRHLCFDMLLGGRAWLL